MPLDVESLYWSTRAEFERHYRKHRYEIGARSRDAYLQSARETVRLGKRFTFDWKGGTRVGYYHRQTKRFASLAADERSIITHYLTSERQGRNFRGSTYA